MTDGYRLIPGTFSTEAYRFLFNAPRDLIRAYGVTILVTFAGTLFSLTITSMAAYVLSSQTFRYRNAVSFFFYFTTVFGGGLVPWYVFNIKYMHFKNSLLGLIIPMSVNVTYLLILKSYMRSIPEEVYESARMMYPRLKLLQKLLAEDGAIFISIGDDENASLKLICNEIFGETNFVDTIIWQKIYTIKNSAQFLSGMHDYIVVYAKNKGEFHRNLFPRTEEIDSSYSNPDNDPRGPWITNAVQARNYYAQGSYEIVSPTGRVFTPPSGTYAQGDPRAGEQEGRPGKGQSRSGRAEGHEAQRGGEEGGGQH